MLFNKLRVERYLSLLFLTSTLNANYLSNDFRDKSNKFYLSNTTDLVSNQLTLKTFDNKWQKLPNYTIDNKIFGYTNTQAYYTFNNFTIGLFKRKIVDLEVNDGFIETWYKIENDFSGLLSNETIGSTIDDVSIKGNASFLDTNGIFISKIYRYYDNLFNIRLNYFKAKDFQYLDIYGQNSNTFNMGFDYYYASKNRISKDKDHDDTYSGEGYGFDLEYIYAHNKYYFYTGIFNIGASIHWKNITKMHYDFDSGYRYIGADGLWKYKDSSKTSFGTGYYKYNTTFVQDLPMYLKSTFDYCLNNNNYNIGINLDYYKNDIYSEPYITMKLLDKLYTRIGYLLENKISIFGLKYKDYYIEVSNKLGSSDNTVLSGGFKIYY
jgi:hypothetical protein